MRRIPVILDTDIGLDIDDTWALAFLLGCPEFDVKLITTVFGDTRAKATLTARLLTELGRTEVPIGIGVGSSMALSPQMQLVEGFAVDRYLGEVFEDGVKAMADVVFDSADPVTIIAIGPASNLASCLERFPAVVESSRIVGMYGSVRLGYGSSDSPSPECNVVCDVAAAQKVFGSSWPMTIAPLDTCGDLVLEGRRYERFARAAASGDGRDGTAAQANAAWAIMSHYEAFLTPGIPDGQSTVLFDVVAVYLALKEEAFEVERLRLSVTDDGYTVEDPKGDAIDAAMRWKLPSEREALAEMLLARLGVA